MSEPNPHGCPRLTRAEKRARLAEVMDDARHHRISNADLALATGLPRPAFWNSRHARGISQLPWGTGTPPDAEPDLERLAAHYGRLNLVRAALARRRAGP